MRYAAIDCGTNAIRLLIAEVDGDTVHDIERRMETVRLGEGVDATGELSDAAIARTLTVVDQYATAIRDHTVHQVRMVATSAVRDAQNSSEFVRGVHERLGVQPEVLTGQQEAELAFRGALGGLAATTITPPILVTDIGGGSTEIVLSDHTGTAVASWCSVNIGCVRMTERHLRSDPPTMEEVDAARADIDQVLADVDQRMPLHTARTLVGLAGSVTTVAAIALGLDHYDATRIHGSTTTYSEVTRVTDTLMGMSRQQRAAEPVMHPGRVDVIAGGSLVLQRLMTQARASAVIASETDVLDGIVRQLSSGL